MTFNKLLSLFEWLFLPKKFYVHKDFLDFGEKLIDPFGISDFLKAPEMPEAPDYAALAEQTAAGSKVDQYTPWGSSIYTDIGDGRFQQDVTLAPGQQQLFDINQQTSIGMAETGLAGLEATKGMFGTPFSIGSEAPTYAGPQGDVPAYEGIGDFAGSREEVREALMARAGTDIARDRENKESELIARGIPRGSEAFSREMEQLDRQLTDARQRAEVISTDQAIKEHTMGREDAKTQFINDAISRGMTSQEAMTAYNAQTGEHRQNITDTLLERQTPLNELSAFRSGTQVGMPQFPGTPLGPDYLGAGQAQSQYDMGGYNADVSRQNAMLQGLFGLGAAGIAASDIRLKHNINKIGELPSGLNVYEFSYIWDNIKHIGVMAQEVLKVIPEAVITMKNGYMAVDYSMVK